MKKELFDELLESVKEAAEIERGELAPSRKFEFTCQKTSPPASGTGSDKREGEIPEF